MTPWTADYQASLSMGFSRQEHWSGLPFLSPGDLPDPGIKLASLTSHALAGGSFTTSIPQESLWYFVVVVVFNNAFFSLYLQCPWMSDVCLVQCARGNRPNSTNCIIFEINKFLIGLELVQERQLHLETNILKVEDDTNCSLSSIEEDFLTASEHLEEESEVEEYRNGENFPVK